jgi:hypothetical protein
LCATDIFPQSANFYARQLVELPEVELPEVELPEVELPEVELPEVELPEDVPRKGFAQDWFA